MPAFVAFQVLGWSGPDTWAITWPYSATGVLPGWDQVLVRASCVT